MKNKRGGEQPTEGSGKIQIASTDGKEEDPEGQRSGDFAIIYPLFHDCILSSCVPFIVRHFYTSSGARTLFLRTL
jgi:hypothetical protein